MNDVFSKIKSGDLYSLLASCSNEDLAPLVSYITDKLSNYLVTDDIYKRHSPDHTKYTKLIASEIRLYGGNSVSNIARGGVGPDYDEVLFDVCQKIGIPSTKGRILDNESNLLRICLPYGWEALSPVNQQAAVKKARDTYATTGGIVTTGVGTATIFATAIRTIAVPVGVGLIAKGVADPAFEVTIPCVLHIAYLRWKVLNYIENHRKKTLQIANVSASTNSQLVVNRDSPLIIGEDADKPVLTFALAKISKHSPVNWQPVSESDGTGISSFNPLLQAVPSMVTKMHIATTQYVEVNIRLDSLTPVKNSTDELRGYVIGSNGRITEQAKLLSPENLEKIVNAGALFQVASVIVAQKHLADISQKLTEIKKTVDDIHKHQKDKRETDITGAVDYFKQIAPSILAGELRDSYEHQIEKYEGELLSIRNHLLKDIKNQNHEIENLKDGHIFGTEGIKALIKKHQNELFNLYQQLFLCIRARACGWQLLLAFPRTEEIAKSRKQNIDESLAVLNVDGELVKQTIAEMDKKIRSLSAITNTAQTLNERKLDLLKWQDKLIEEITYTRSEIDANIRSVESLVQDKHGATKFLLKVEGDKIVARSPL
ncbi:hypothetical protein ACH5Y9_09805 [Methylomonas sp. BW4-1]|uniref:hypothetical protein n=1 Tax=Methylomonas sp. BW4-1 TaxID=3376685 RepID=UPI00404263F5